MKQQYRYTLEPYKGPSTRYTCPQCGKKKTFTRYIDTRTGEHLPEQFGRCDREVNCGYHAVPEVKTQKSKPKSGNWLNPGGRNPKRQISNPGGLNSKGQIPNPRLITNTLPLTTTFSTIPYPLFAQSFSDDDDNYLAAFLRRILGEELGEELLQRYYVGTHSHWDGATVFWQVDELNRIRTGKIMLYNGAGRRVKEPYNHVHWVHVAAGLEGYNLQQCLFGQHLLHGNTKTVYVVESEKTALIAAAYMPQFLWVATGGVGSLTVEKLKPLDGNNIVLMPDLGAIEKWQAVAQQHGNCMVSTRMAEYAAGEDFHRGLDIADYLLWHIRHLTG